MMSGISNNNHNFTGAVGKAVITHSKTAESGKESRIGKINRKPDQISKDGDTLELSKKKVPDAPLFDASGKIWDYVCDCKQSHLIRMNK